MMGLTPVQSNCLEFLKQSRAASVMPTYREIRDHLGIKSIGRAHKIVAALEERGLVRRMSNRPRALQVVDPKSMHAVLLSPETFGLARIYASNQGIGVDAAVDAIVRERLWGLA